MSNHIWVTGEPVDCAQVGMHAFATCSVCGVYRVDGDPYTFLRFETSVPVSQDTIIAVERRATRVRRADHWIHLSLDCQVAQEQVLFYVLGRLQALMAVDGQRYGGGTVITKAIEDRVLPCKDIMRAYRALEAQVRSPDDLRSILEGLEVGGPPFTGPLLDVDL